MNTPSTLHTTAGDYPLAECRIAVGSREWVIAYTAAIVSKTDESRFLAGRAKEADAMPYGVALWPAALALAHEIAIRPLEFEGKRVLELGAGTGLPGIVASSLGAKVIQTDRQELALHICKLNGQRNRATGIEYRMDDWNEWNDTDRYDWLIGSDILYADSLHDPLRRIFECNLAPGGRLLLADPYRADSLPLLESLEAGGWRVTHSRWAIGESASTRPIAVYDIVPPTR